MNHSIQLLHPSEIDTACYLETSQPANVSFYEKLGFRIVRELVDPVSGLTIWTFCWDAHTLA